MSNLTFSIESIFDEDWSGPQVVRKVVGKVYSVDGMYLTPSSYVSRLRSYGFSNVALEKGEAVWLDWKNTPKEEKYRLNVTKEELLNE